MMGQSRPVNQRTSKRINGLARSRPRELHKHLLRGSQLDRSTLRQEFEQLHQAWPWSGLARFGPTHRRAFRVASGPIVPRSAFISQHWFASERPSPSARERVSFGPSRKEMITHEGKNLLELWVFSDRLMMLVAWLWNPEVML